MHLKSVRIPKLERSSFLNYDKFCFYCFGVKPGGVFDSVGLPNTDRLCIVLVNIRKQMIVVLAYLRVTDGR